MEWQERAVKAECILRKLANCEDVKEVYDLQAYAQKHLMDFGAEKENLATQA